jgi:CubicO group peptidase (beta-lactamase class C family)
VQNYILAGTVEDFGVTAQTAFKENLATAVGVAPSQISLAVSAASINVTATIATESDTASQSLLSSLNTLAGVTLFEIRTRLGVKVKHVDKARATSVVDSRIVLPTSTPEEQGMNGTRLQEAVERAFEERVNDLPLKRSSYTQAVTIVRNGAVVFEKYKGMSTDLLSSLDSVTDMTPKAKQTLKSDKYSPRDASSLTTSWSMAKSITAFLVGVAVEEKFLASFDAKASVYIAEWSNTGDARENITIRQLLNMRSGLTPKCCTQNSTVSQTCEDCTKDFLTSPLNVATGYDGQLLFLDDQRSICLQRTPAEVNASWYDVTYAGDFDSYIENSVTRERDQSYTPGETYVYQSCDTVVLGELLERATKITIAKYAEQKLFSVIGMDAEWWQDAAENHPPYCCIDATQRDFVKFGELLRRGLSNKAFTDAAFRTTKEDYYGMQLRVICPQSGSAHEDCGRNGDNAFLTLNGLDGQYVAISRVHNLVIARSSLYVPVFNGTRTIDVLNEYAPLSAPRVLTRRGGYSTFYFKHLLYDVLQAVV